MQNLVDFYTSFEGLNIQTFAQESKLNFFPQNFSVKFYIQTVSHRLSLPLLQKQVKLQQNNGRPSSLAIVFGPLKQFNIVKILFQSGRFIYDSVQRFHFTSRILWYQEQSNKILNSQKQHGLQKLQIQ
ncbi:Hypothetical_protein [Hexamita inflata]|uniref:Hypothetical_protein n=1 Tax=Hexamita inflata TaxID=28002 RepID=A0AA86R0I6_9EUKA|nr:Hypothetical protein HINF_LOCUS52300 [Hexamita inflata]CAI9964656.1 Hypothetical protein HINF_LOCUS52301 [Hexamita inflata]